MNNNQTTHTLYEKGDPDAPESIKDRNGDIALRLCKICGRGEFELAAPCAPRIPNDDVLNEASWAFVEAMPFVLSGEVFNHVKPALQFAIEKWLSGQCEPNPVEAIDAEFDSAEASDDPRAVDTLVEALDQTLRARGLTIVPAEELAGEVRELSAALLDEQRRLEWLMQKVNCDEIGDEIRIPFGLSLGRHFDEFRRQIDQAKGEGDRG
ncbi:hypothetical protein [Cupriavidus basilensis]|uniref:hypothetical protein n=1 Tax=Cupriavidus basilensis TaxID=68895 RepID=UPI0020A6BB97|nr:hypothetical protein [Cupriavidus basilensis]MCP3017443.1 hypothetical protein [Cupriavidus basilensis]